MDVFKWKSLKHRSLFTVHSLQNFTSAKLWFRYRPNSDVVSLMVGETEALRVALEEVNDNR